MNSDFPSLRFGPVSNAVDGPLYEQVVAGVEREIAAGRLSPGDHMPSIRGLASDLLVSVITVTRAYAELERAGLIYSRQGVGAFVTDDARALISASRRLEVEQALATAAVAARQARMPTSAVIEILRNLLDEQDQS